MQRDIVEYFRINPENTCLETLSPLEVTALVQTSNHPEIHALLQRCALAVLNSAAENDNVMELLSTYHDFDIKVSNTAGGIVVELFNVPRLAFVSYDARDASGRSCLNHKIIEGLRQHIFAVIRDLVFIHNEITLSTRHDLSKSKGITDAVFVILRNAGVFSKTGRHKVVTLWGGHSIRNDEYGYSLKLGNSLGLRFMDVITGCGPGAMRGPMEGAAIGHAMQRVTDGRYIGVSEPGIIASEAPNSIVDPLVIMPDIEKRLEAFVRLGQGIIIFPGGVGTMEEICYLLGLLTHPKNSQLPMPLILTGPESARGYWEVVDGFLQRMFGEMITRYYQIIIGDSDLVARELNKGLLAVKQFRDSVQDSYFFNTRLHIPFELQQPFDCSHESVAAIKLSPDMDPHTLTVNIRRVFSAIVGGNVRPEGIRAIEEYGPFLISGDRVILEELQCLLQGFADQNRARLSQERMPILKILN
jgi:predicted Rossmann-fold nucleotide-binding protein